MEALTVKKVKSRFEQQITGILTDLVVEISGRRAGYAYLDRLLRGAELILPNEIVAQKSHSRDASFSVVEVYATCPGRASKWGVRSQITNEGELPHRSS